MPTPSKDPGHSPPATTLPNLSALSVLDFARLVYVGSVPLPSGAASSPRCEKGAPLRCHRCHAFAFHSEELSQVSVAWNTASDEEKAPMWYTLDR